MNHLHLLSAPAGVIMAHEVKDTMNEEESKLLCEAQTRFLGLPHCRFHGDDHIP